MTWEIFKSVDELIKTGEELGYTKKEIGEALAGFDGLPLDEDNLEGISGGLGYWRVLEKNRRGSFY